MDGGGDQYVRHWERLSGLGELGEILADLKGRTFHRWHIRREVLNLAGLGIPTF